MNGARGSACRRVRYSRLGGRAVSSGRRRLRVMPVELSRAQLLLTMAARSGLGLARSSCPGMVRDRAAPVGARRGGGHLSHRRSGLTPKGADQYEHEHSRANGGDSWHRGDSPGEPRRKRGDTTCRRGERLRRTWLCPAATQFCCRRIPDRALSPRRQLPRGRQRLLRRRSPWALVLVRIALSMPQWDDLRDQPVLAVGRNSITVAWWHYSSSMRFNHRCFIENITKSRCFC